MENLETNLNNFDNKNEEGDFERTAENSQQIAGKNLSSTSRDDFMEIQQRIDTLPEFYPDALDILKMELAPKIALLGQTMQDHLINLLKKKLKISKVAIRSEIANAMEAICENAKRNENTEIKNDVDPEIREMAKEISLDPMLFKKRIDLLNEMGVVGERKPVGMYLTVIDSRLLPAGIGSEALALKNSGHYGSGKSYPMLMCLRLYPESAYYLITSGSSKSLYNLTGGLKHKALILTEALCLQDGSDSELAYAVRSLISEGSLVYQVSDFDENGARKTVIRKMEGPTSLLTTTVQGKLESQLEDRLITVHPNTTVQQTHEILKRTADLASGKRLKVDQKIIQAWQFFHESLKPEEVVIPYSGAISEFLSRSGALPLSARRAFKRVLSMIKTIAVVHQFQREKDSQGRIVAEISDYAMTFQLINESFRESLGVALKFTDDRIRMIEEKGQISPRDLAKETATTVSAVSQWAKPWLDKGVLSWCDDQGYQFDNEMALERAKRVGNAYLKVVNAMRLPSPFEIVHDQRWNIGGELYERFNLSLDDWKNADEQKDNQKNTSMELTDCKADNDIIELGNGAKALSELGGVSDFKRVDFVAGLTCQDKGTNHSEELGILNF